MVNNLFSFLTEQYTQKHTLEPRVPEIRDREHKTYLNEMCSALPEGEPGDDILSSVFSSYI